MRKWRGGSLETPFDVLRHVVDGLEAAGIRYAIGGSIASMAYGEPRSTTDLDVVIQLERSDVPRLLAHFPRPDFYVDPQAADVAWREGGQFNVIHPYSGVKIDFFVGRDPIARLQVDRARQMETLEGFSAAFSPPEELIIKKLTYYAAGGSERHLRDIASMLRISPDAIDRERVRELAAGEGLLDIWMQVLERTDGPT